MSALGRKTSTVNPKTVAKAVISQLIKASSAQLVLPHRFSILSALREVSNWFEQGPKDEGKDWRTASTEYHLSLSEY
jgi:hypothetical protein